ncbi:MAG TPA: ABC transporter substrate-binding protein [Alphaproteobacteria bacterium]
MWWGRLAASVIVLAMAAASPAGAAEPANVKFSLDWLLQGQQAPFILTQERGYYRQAGVNLTALDAGRGSTDTIGKVASGVYEIGFGDLGALIEFNAKNPGKEMMGVLMIYDQAPLAIVSLKKAGINKPADLKGNKGAAPSFDSTYRLFNVFARVNGFDPAGVQWANVAPQLREPMLARGETDAIAGFSFTSQLSLRGLGVPDAAISTLMYRDHGVDMYSNVVIVAPSFLKARPDAVRGFVKATIHGWRDAYADPAAAIAALKRRDPLTDEAVEIERLKMAFDFIFTSHVRRSGMGDVEPARLQKNIDLVTEGFQLPRKIKPDEVFSAAYLPAPAERGVTQ